MLSPIHSHHTVTAPIARRKQQFLRRWVFTKNTIARDNDKSRSKSISDDNGKPPPVLDNNNDNDDKEYD